MAVGRLCYLVIRFKSKASPDSTEGEGETPAPKKQRWLMQWG